MGNPAAVAFVFTEPNQKLANFVGEARILATALTGRYDRYSFLDLWSAKLFGRIQAATTFGPLAGASSLIIFYEPTFSVGNPGYFGPFIQLTNFNQQFEFDFNLSEGGLDPNSSYGNSLLLVHTQRALELKLSFNNLFLPQLAQFLNGLPSEITPSAPATLTWQAFPEGFQYLSPKSIYLTVLQYFTVEAPLGDYSAYVQFYIQLTISGGVLSGHVQRYDWWVEGGLFTDSIVEKLVPNVKLAVITLNSALANLAPNVTVNDVYYLPGSQVNWPIGPGEWNVFFGNTFDDVTIVLEL